MAPFELRRLIFLPILFLGGHVAWAGNDNRNLFPLGEREAFLANTGTALGGSTAALYYNPAALVQIQGSRIAFEGTTYSMIRAHSDSLANFDNTDLPYTASGFTPIPQSLISTMASESWTFAWGVLVPEASKFRNKTAWTTPNTRTSIVQDHEENELWLGGAVANRLNSEWAWGASVFGIRHTEAQTVALDLTTPANDQNLVTSLSHSQAQVLGISAIVGILYSPTELFQLGFRVQSPLVRLTGDADILAVTHSLNANTGAPVLTSTNDEHEGTPAYYPLPTDLSLGFSLHPGELRFLADVSAQLPLSYDALPEISSSKIVELRLTPRVSAGVEWEFLPGSLISFGARYNPSSRDLANGDAGDSVANFWGVAAGLRFESERLQSGFGAYYSWSSGELITAGTGGRSPYSVQGFGALITVGYRL